MAEPQQPSQASEALKVMMSPEMEKAVSEEIRLLGIEDEGDATARRRVNAFGFIACCFSRERAALKAE